MSGGSGEREGCLERERERERERGEEKREEKEKALNLPYDTQNTHVRERSYAVDDFASSSRWM